MPDREPVDPERLRRVSASDRLVKQKHTEQYYFGATFMGTTSLVMPLRPTTQRRVILIC